MPPPWQHKQGRSPRAKSRVDHVHAAREGLAGVPAMDLLAMTGSVPGGPSRLHRSERCMAGFPTKDRSHARDPTRPAARGFFVLHAGVGHGVRPTETGLIWVRPRRGLVSCVWCEWCEWCVPTVRKLLYDRGLSASHAFSFFFSTSNSLPTSLNFFSHFLSRLLSFFESPESFASLLSLSFSNTRCDLRYPADDHYYYVLTLTTSPVRLYWHHEVPISCYPRSCGC